MNLPRNAQIWFPGYVRDRIGRIGERRPRRIWLAIGDHFEPFCENTDEGVARDRVALWRRRWPEIAGRHRDSAGRPPQYTFFYPQEEYRPHLIDALTEMVRMGIADVEVHIHHDGEGQQNFLDRMNGFVETLHGRHGLLRKQDGKIVFGFIHGNWALDNSRADGRWCGLNNEITLLRDLGCYADFTMPSGASPTQARTVNRIYWAVDDPARPKSYDSGISVAEGTGDILMIPGPFGVRWTERLVPRIEKGELAGYDWPSRYRVRRWIDLAPRIDGDGDAYIKLFTHGTQERNSGMLLNGGLDRLFTEVAAECRASGLEYRYVTAWEMRQAIGKAAGI